MGCDIHLIAERRRSYQANYGIRYYWTRIVPPAHLREARDYMPKSNEPCRDYDDAEREMSEWYSERDYPLFGVLAGVRRDGPPIAQPRDLPPDLSDKGHAYFREGGGDHTASWLTLAELLAYDWDAADYPQTEDFRHRVIPALQLAGAPDDVRIVFNFDN